MNKLNIHLVVVLTTLFFACNESDPAEDISLKLEGEYTGTFTVDYLHGDTHSNPVTITFSEDGYSSSIGENRIPAGGAGTFQIKNDTISFTDVNSWTADFDWNLILSGPYQLVETDTKITFSAQKNDVGTYTYELSKK